MRALNAILNETWAIREEALRTMVEVATRANLDPQAVATQLGRPLDNTRTTTVRDGVAIIPVVGPIFRYANLFTAISGATSTEVLATDFGRALADPSVRAILLQVDSPGGEVTGIADLATLIYQAREKKPVRAYVEGGGASGAYWLASAAERVVVSPSAVVGSIGVYAAYRDTSKQDEARGIQTIEFVSSQSPNKRPDPASEKGRGQIQATIDGIATAFVAQVARNRGTTAERVLSDFGAGGVLVGEAAVLAGMADAVGTFEETLAALAETPAGYGTGIRAQEGAGGDQPMSLWEQIQAALGGGQSAPPPEEPPPARPESATPPAAPDPRIAELSRQLATERAARIETAAEQFVAAHSDRLVPAERAAVRELYVQAATDDAAHPLAEGSRVASLSAREAARRPHRLREELLPAGSAILGNAPPSAEEEEADLAASIARARRTAGERPGNGRAH